MLEQPGEVVREEVAVGVGAGGIAGEGLTAVRAPLVDVVDVGDDVLADPQGPEVVRRHARVAVAVDAEVDDEPHVRVVELLHLLDPRRRQRVVEAHAGVDLDRHGHAQPLGQGQHGADDGGVGARDQAHQGEAQAAGQAQIGAEQLHLLLGGQPAVLVQGGVDEDVVGHPLERVALHDRVELGQGLLAGARGPADHLIRQDLDALRPHLLHGRDASLQAQASAAVGVLERVQRHALLDRHN